MLLSAKVVRQITNRIAVEFGIDRAKEKHLVTALKQFLDDKPLKDG